MTRIVICRHANTFDKGDVITRVGARTDLPLSNSGRRQAEQLAEHFASNHLNFNFTRAYCSPLIRTHQTGDVILKSAHIARELKMLHFLTEVDYGVDENMPEETVISRLGREAIELWDSQATVPDGWHVDPQNLIRSWASFLEMHENFGQDVLVVTSNGIARFVLDAVDEIATDAPRKLRTAAYGVVEIENGRSKLSAWDIRAA